MFTELRRGNLVTSLSLPCLEILTIKILTDKFYNISITLYNICLTFFPCIFGTKLKWTYPISALDSYLALAQ